jgi:hypothetical protein
MNHQTTHGITKGTATPYGESYADHRRVMGLRQAERVRIRRVKKELVRLFKEIFEL